MKMISPSTTPTRQPRRPTRSFPYPPKRKSGGQLERAGPRCNFKHLSPFQKVRPSFWNILYQKEGRTFWYIKKTLPSGACQSGFWNLERLSMPRPLLIRSDRFPYHVCARSNNKEWFYLPIGEVWNIFCEKLALLSEDFSLQTHAFVLMSNHFHALVTTPGADLDEAMLYLLREVAREINRRSGRINHIFGAPYKWSMITNKVFYSHALRYIYQNPVKAGIVDRVESYAYSTLRYLIHKRYPGFPISESIYDREAVMDLAIWQKIDFLNSRVDKREADCVRRALGRSIFKLSSHRRNGANTLKNLWGSDVPKGRPYLLVHPWERKNPGGEPAGV